MFRIPCKTSLGAAPKDQGARQPRRGIAAFAASALVLMSLLLVLGLAAMPPPGLPPAPRPWPGPESVQLNLPLPSGYILPLDEAADDAPATALTLPPALVPAFWRLLQATSLGAAW